jgi:hypothetical protein
VGYIRDLKATTLRGDPRSFVGGDTASHKQLLEEAGTTLRALSVVLKWVGVALLVIAALMAVYMGASLLGELAVWATYP